MEDRKVSTRYQLEERILTFHDVEVFKARDSFLPRPVIATVFRKCDFSSDPEFRRRIQSVAKLSHPNIMSTFDLEYGDRDCYLISEYQSGRSLHDVLGNQAALHVKEALRIAFMLTDAMAHAHEQNVVHGNLQPDLIWLADDELKLSFVSPLLRQPILHDKQSDLKQLGQILQSLFARVELTDHPMQSKLREVVERLMERRQPAYRNVSDASYDLKMMLEKYALHDGKEFGKEFREELAKERQTAVEQIAAEGEREALLGKRRPAKKRRAVLRASSSALSYWITAIGTLAAGVALSLSVFNETPDLPENSLTTGIENGTSGLAMAETPQSDSTITISPKEPISKIAAAANEPDLIGMSREEAERLLLSRHLRYAYYLVRSDAPKGTVFKQEWDPTTARPHSRIIFYVSSGSQL